MSQTNLDRRSTQASRRTDAVRTVVAVALGTCLLGFAAVPRASADEFRVRTARAVPRPLASPSVAVPQRSARWPGLVAPALPGEAKRGWTPAPAGRLRFDAQRAWWELASLLEVLPVLPRLDGAAQPTRDPHARLRALSASIAAPNSGGSRFLGELVGARSASATAAPGGALRGVGTRILRALGLASIAGEAVFVLEGTVDAEDAADDAVLDALPSRSWHAPTADDAEIDGVASALRTTRGRRAMGVTTRVTLRSAAVRLVGTF
jgi:hypothetical protein